jgi:hypothetical protein
MTRDQLGGPSVPPRHEAPPAEPRRLATFPRGTDGSEELRIELAEFKGKEFVNVRIWFRGEDGKFYPTKRGVSLKLRELPEIVSALSDPDLGRWRGMP